MENTKPPAAGRGRPKGSPNKISAAVKDMVSQALDKAGGVDYLLLQAHDNPTAFLTLVGKIIPLQVSAELEGRLVHEVTHRVID